jgi:hypothetical protein
MFLPSNFLVKRGPQTPGRVARAGYTLVKTGETSVYSRHMADLSQGPLSGRFQLGHDLRLNDGERCP